MKAAITNVINSSWPTIVIVISIVLIMRITLALRSERKNFNLYSEIFNMLFMVYLIILFEIVTSQDVSISSTNFIPFKEILRYDYGTQNFYNQVIGNILLFVPLGYFASSFCKIKGLGTITIVALLSSLSIETVQYFIGRCFDVDDILLNVVGGIIGFLIYTGLVAIRNHLPKFLRKKWFLNLISIIIVAIFVLYLLKVI